MSKSNPVWNDIIKARPDMTEKEAKNADRKLGYVRVSMLRRCNNPDDKDYNTYGGRGIKVCREWSDPVTGLRDFAVWSIRNGWAPGLTIDRENNDGPYSPDNCRWVTRLEQAYNRSTNKSITLRVPMKVIQRLLRKNGYKMRELLNKGQEAIEEELIKSVSGDWLDSHRDRKTHLYMGCCPVCGEPAEHVYRTKSRNNRWVIIGCPHCVKTTDIYNAAVEAGVFD